MLAAGLYLYGVHRLRPRGDRWPVGRTVLFLGPASARIAAVTRQRPRAYDTTLLSRAHGPAHGAVMVAPIFLALGAPVTLALRTLPAAAAPAAAGGACTAGSPGSTPSRWSRSAIFVVNPFVLYFTGLYRLTLRARVACTSWCTRTSSSTGCLFFWPLLGLDPLPGRWPYPARALLMLLSMPFHTVLGLTIMQSTTLLGGDWYPSLRPGLGRPVRPTRWSAGGILWAGGEFVSVTMLARAGRAVDARSPSGRPAGSTASWTARRPASRRGAAERAEAPGRRHVASRRVGTPRPDGPTGAAYDQRAADDGRSTRPMSDRLCTVLLYSDDPQVRDRMRLAIGTRPAADLQVEFVEASDLRRGASGSSTTTRSTCWCSTARRAPAGGLGIARQLKDEVDDRPPTCVVIARAADRWLAAYAEVDATLMHPLDPVTTGQTVAELLRARAAGRPPSAATAPDAPCRHPARTARSGGPPWANGPGRTCSPRCCAARSCPPPTPPGRWARSWPARRRPAQIAGFVVALRAKGETPAELAGLVEAMLGRGGPGRPARRAAGRRGRRGRHRRRPGAHRQHLHDGRARGRPAPGCRVVKHGNRAASSSCGAADLLEDLGVPLDLGPARGGPLRRRGRHRLLLRGPVPPRHAARRPRPAASWACPTVVQLPRPADQPGPAPAPARSAASTPRMAAGDGRRVRRPRRLGAGDARRGRAGRVHHRRADPGLGGPGRHRHGGAAGRRRPRGTPGHPADLRGGDAAFNADVARRLLAGETGPVRDAVLVNAAAALAAQGPLDGDLTEALRAGIARAAESDRLRRRRRVLDRWIEVARSR